MDATLSHYARPVPAKVVIERRARRGAEFAFIDWVDRFTQTAARAEGHEGTSVLSAPNHVRFILLRFASQAQLDLWQQSPDYERLIREGDAFSVPGDPEQSQSGFETWFTLPDEPAPVAPPPKWKMALVTWTGLFPVAVAMSFIVAPLQLTFIPQTALSTAVPVALLTWLIMPRLTRVLYRWLYNQSNRTTSEGEK